MIDVFSTLQVVLQEAGFTTHLTSIDHTSIVCFEDEALLGFGCVFDDPSALIANWKATELSLLKHYAPSLRAAGAKAWNVYCLFLCGAAADPIQNREVSWIEENLDQTRKVTACGLTSREDLKRALLPILPLQYQPELRPEDITERLNTRICTIAPRASQVVLVEAVPVVEVVPLLGGLA